MNDIEQYIINLVKDEVNAYTENLFFITDKVAFEMRSLTKEMRKNYWGVFDDPVDKITGQKKIHAKLSQRIIESVRKSIDVDQKDVRFRSKSGQKGIPITELVRAENAEILSSMNFGELLDENLLSMCIDGMFVWKTIEGKDDEGKPLPIVTAVDILNLFYDPSAKNLQTVARVTERSLMTKEEMEVMSWDNVDLAQTTDNLHPSDLNLTTYRSGKSRFIEVFELWGSIPEWTITGNRNDKKMIEGHAVVSGINGKNPLVHKVERNTKKDKNGKVIRPYEEAWFKKVPNRHQGMGIAEQLFALEMYSNLVLNTRVKRNAISQLGLFKIRSNSGITQSQLSRLLTMGVIRVNDMNDIDMMSIQDGSQSSYRDEQSINEMSRQLTNAFEVITGENSSATATATTTSILDANARSAFVLVQESIGHFLQRWENRHVLPIVVKRLKKGGVVRVAKDLDTIEKLRESVVAHVIQQRMYELFEQGESMTPDEVLSAQAEMMDKLRRNGDLFIEMTDEVLAKDLDAQVITSNEKINVPVVVQNLIQIASLDPVNARHYIDQAIDLLGLDKPSGNAQTQQLGAPEGMKEPMGRTAITTNANTLNGQATV